MKALLILSGILLSIYVWVLIFSPDARRAEILEWTGVILAIFTIVSSIVGSFFIKKAVPIACAGVGWIVCAIVFFCGEVLERNAHEENLPAETELVEESVETNPAETKSATMPNEEDGV